MQRRQHRKSRRGCVECKKKHIKCDEAKPQCHNCERSSIECHWQAAPGGQAALLLPPSPAARQSKVVDVPLAVPDLRLLHQWTLHTSHTLANQHDLFFWQTTLVNLGFQHPFLLRIILAVAAVHLAFVRPSEAAAMHLLSSAHMDEAIAVFRGHVEFPDPATCGPTFAAASLIVVHGLGASQTRDLVDPLAEAASWMRLIQGVSAMTSTFWPRLLSLEVAPLIHAAMSDRELRDTSKAFNILEDLVEQAHAPETSARKSCLHAIAELRIISANCIKNRADQGRPSAGVILSWSADLQPEFVDLIAEKDPVALLILARSTVVSRLRADLWYMRRWDTLILDAVSTSTGPKYQEWIERVLE